MGHQAVRPGRGVTHGAAGKVKTVRYSMLTSMLPTSCRTRITKLQDQTGRTQQAEELRQQTEQIRELTARAVRQKRGARCAASTFWGDAFRLGSRQCTRRAGMAISGRL